MKEEKLEHDNVTTVKHWKIKGKGVILKKDSLEPNSIITRSKYLAQYMDWCSRNKTVPWDISTLLYVWDEKEELNFKIRSYRDNSKGKITIEEVLFYLLVEDFGDDLQMAVSNSSIIFYKEEMDDRTLEALHIDVNYTYNCFGDIVFNGEIEFADTL